VISQVVPLSPSEIRINRARTRSGKNSRQYAEAKSTFAADVRAHVRDLRARGAIFPFRGALILTLDLFMPNGSVEFDGLPIGDTDGPIKGIKDALKKAGVYFDDIQVKRLTVEKHLDAANPRIAYRVESWTR